MKAKNSFLPQARASANVAGAGRISSIIDGENDVKCGYDIQFLPGVVRWSGLPACQSFHFDNDSDNEDDDDDIADDKSEDKYWVDDVETMTAMVMREDVIEWEIATDLPNNWITIGYLR